MRFGVILGRFLEVKIYDFRMFCAVFSKQISTADRTRKMVPIMAPNRGTEIDFLLPVRAGGVGRGRGGVILMYMRIVHVPLHALRPKASAD